MPEMGEDPLSTAAGSEHPLTNPLPPWRASHPCAWKGYRSLQEGILPPGHCPCFESVLSLPLRPLFCSCQAAAGGCWLSPSTEGGAGELSWEKGWEKVNTSSSRAVFLQRDNWEHRESHNESHWHRLIHQIWTSLIVLYFFFPFSKQKVEA